MKKITCGSSEFQPSVSVSTPVSDGTQTPGSTTTAATISQNFDLNNETSIQIEHGFGTQNSNDGYVYKPTFIDSSGNYRDIPCKRIDKDTIEINSNPGFSGRVIIQPVL